MNTSQKSGLRISICLAVALNLLLACKSIGGEPPKESQVPLEIKLPAPAFKGTPKDIQLSSYVEPLSDKPRPPMMVPAGLKNIAPSAKITCSDKNAMPDALAKLTDGDKEAG